MAKRNDIEFVTPFGSRLVWGNVHKAKLKTKRDGSPVFKTGTQEQASSFDFGIAIKKTPGVTHWNQEAWGKGIWDEAHAGYGAMADRPDFSFKVTDGDSTIPNTKGNRPCDQAGHPGHWVVAFSSMSAPQLFNATSGAAKPDSNPEIMLPGDFVQVMGSYVCNHDKNGNAAESPGVYLNHRAVCYGGQHPDGRITTQAPVNAGLFGAGVAPGGTAGPTAGFTPAVSAPPVAPAPLAPTAVTPSATFVPVAPPAAPKLTPETDGWAVHPDNPAFMWKGTDVLPVADVRARYA